MGTDIHLEAEALIEGRWMRVPHEPEPCWSCGEWDRETHLYKGQTGIEHVICLRSEMLPDDVVTSERGEWVVLERTQPCKYCNGTKSTHPQFFHGRNYDVFSILANVRNGYGFAGVRTSGGFNPISDGRGIPADLGEEIRSHLKRLGYDVVDGGLEYHRDGEEEDDLYETMSRERDGYWSLGEHSFTWVGLDEIINYDWSQTVMKEGWVDPVEFQRFRETGRPNSWAGGVSGAAVEHITAADMARRIDDGEILFEDGALDEVDKGLGLPARPQWTTSLQRAMSDWSLPEGSTGAAIRERLHIVCSIQWEERYAEAVGASFWQDVEALKSIAPDGDYSKVRLVMGFDS